MKQKIFFAGTGNMGGAILRGLLNAKTDPKSIFFFDPSDKAAEAVSALGCVRVKNFAEGIKKADVTFLCVKPQIFKLVAAEWKDAVKAKVPRKTGRNAVPRSRRSGVRHALFAQRTGAARGIRGAFQAARHDRRLRRFLR